MISADDASSTALVSWGDIAAALGLPAAIDPDPVGLLDSGAFHPDGGTSDGGTGGSGQGPPLGAPVPARTTGGCAVAGSEGPMPGWVTGALVLVLFRRRRRHPGPAVRFVRVDGRSWSSS